MKVIVFGGSGFIGSHIADVLSDEKCEVTVFDRKKSPFLRPGQKMIVGDILDENLIQEAVRGHDIVYNLAGIANIDECAQKPIETVRINILGNSIILEASRKANIKRFVFASSVYVYSESGSFYRSSKQACELFIENYHQLYGLPYTIVRYGSLYGERADERNSIYRIIKEALSTGKIIYHGTGNEMREYIHVNDAAKMSIHILNPEFENKHVILTGPQQMRYADLLDMIKEILSNKIEVHYLPKTSDTHYSITPYNFSPKIGLKLINNPHIDMGQGLLNCMREIYGSLHKNQPEEMGIFVKNENEMKDDA